MQEGIIVLKKRGRTRAFGFSSKFTDWFLKEKFPFDGNVRGNFSSAHVRGNFSSAHH